MTTTKAALAAENAALRKQVADFMLDLEIMRKQAQPAPSQRTQQATPAWHQARAEAMAVAREMAKRMRCVVKV